MYIDFVGKGVCAPKGFKAAGVHCGFRKKMKKDLALIVSDVSCNAAAVYTKNKVKSGPIILNQENLKNGKARAIICNSGNANTCAPNSVEIAQKTCELVADELGISSQDVVVGSTGVIGEPLTMDNFEKGVPNLSKKLSYSGSEAAAKAIMTTDTIIKESAVSFILGNKEVTIGGIAKGSGMINPNMATMLCFITTDASITTNMLEKALKDDVDDTFNQISIDGDTSTNDTVAILANGLAGNEMIIEENEDYDKFCKALNMLTSKLSRKIAKDGEGAKKLIECIVTGAPNKGLARDVSKSVIQSALVKTAIFGEDANWGRIICAVGYAEGEFNVDNVDISLSGGGDNVEVCKRTNAVAFDESTAKKVLSEKHIKIFVNLNQGEQSAIAYGCDLSHEYIKINGDYRS